MDINQQIEKIESVIEAHEYNFYVMGEKTISSAELEVLKLELDNLKNKKMELELVY